MEQLYDNVPCRILRRVSEVMRAATSCVKSVLWSARENSVPAERIFVRFHFVVFYEYL